MNIFHELSVSFIFFLIYIVFKHVFLYYILNINVNHIIKLYGFINTDSLL